MKKLGINVNLYAVFARDDIGSLYLLFGNGASGIKARPLEARDLEGREAMKFFSDYGLHRMEFMRVHRVIGKDDSWTNAEIYNGVEVKLVKDSVFYRRIKFGFDVASLKPHHQQIPTVSTTDKAAEGADAIPVVGSRCHHKTNCITFTGNTSNAHKFGQQITALIDKLWNVKATYVACPPGRSQPADRSVVQVTLTDPRVVGISEVRRIVQTMFK
jgi:hypothetical protein